MNKLLNFIGFQIVWWVFILYQSQYVWLALGILVCHIAFSGNVKKEAAVILLASLPGIVIDSILTLSGVYIFSEGGQILPIPLWLVGLWWAFAATLRHSLSYLRHHYWLASLLGAVGGPLSYIAGMKFGAVSFGYGFYTVSLLLVGIWACLTPLIFFVVNRVEKPAT